MKDSLRTGVSFGLIKNIGVKSSFLTYIIEENPAYPRQAGV